MQKGVAMGLALARGFCKVGRPWWSWGGLRCAKEPLCNVWVTPGVRWWVCGLVSGQPRTPGGASRFTGPRRSSVDRRGCRCCGGVRGSGCAESGPLPLLKAPWMVLSSPRTSKAPRGMTIVGYWCGRTLLIRVYTRSWDLQSTTICLPGAFHIEDLLHLTPLRPLPGPLYPLSEPLTGAPTTPTSAP